MVELHRALIFSVKIGVFMRRVFAIAVFLWSLNVPSLLGAQLSQPVQSQSIQLSPVVVTATRTEVPLAETAASVTVITDEEIRAPQDTRKYPALSPKSAVSE